MAGAGYHPLAKTLHWITALLVLGLIGVVVVHVGAVVHHDVLRRDGIFRRMLPFTN